MTNSKLFKEAIAEAKSLRAAATAEAKSLLEESITPHIKEILASKLEEMEEDEVTEEKEEVTEELGGLEKVKETKKQVKEEEEEPVDDEAEEAAEETGEEEEAAEETEEEPVSDDEEIGNISVEDFRELVRSVIAQEMAPAEPESDLDSDMEITADMDSGEDIPGEEEEMELDTAEEDDEEINLDELLKELEEESTDEAKAQDANSMEKSGRPQSGGKTSKEDVYKKFGLKDKKPSSGLKTQTINGVPHKMKDGKWVPLTKVSERDSAELNEALKTIDTLKKEMKEINLLNAKLLYVNKMFKSGNLTENQKAHVIAAFDDAETVKEVKLVYKTLFENKESIGKKSKKPVHEHKFKGSASKPLGNSTVRKSKEEDIQRVDETVERMQRLAGIIKD